MNTKNIKRSICIILTIVAFLQCNFRSRALPDFKILLMDSTTIFNTSQIPKGKAFVLVYFSPDCDHCQKETRDILANIHRVKDTKFYFVTANRFEELRAFDKEYKLTSYPNLVVGRDFELYIIKNFKNATPPYLAIYDKDKLQRAVFLGQAKAEKIIEVLNNIDG